MILTSLVVCALPPIPLVGNYRSCRRWRCCGNSRFFSALDCDYRGIYICVCVFVCVCLHLCVHVMSPLHRALLTGGLGAETKFIAEFSTDLKSSIEALRLWRRVSVRTLIYTSLPSLITSELRVGRWWWLKGWEVVMTKRLGRGERERERERERE